MLITNKLMRPIDWLFSFLVMIVGLLMAHMIVVRSSGMPYSEFLTNVRKAMFGSKVRTRKGLHDQLLAAASETEETIDMRLQNKVALITGGTGGMGRASARLFAQEGATVFVAARRPKPGAALVQEIVAADGRAHFIQLDTTDQAAWDVALAKVKENAGALHVLLNIVGTNDLTLIPNISMKEWNKVFEVNINGTLMGIQTCAQLMKDSGGGSIINVGSVAGITGTFSAAYSASKWALEGLSRGAAYTLADWGIRCNVIQPGFIETDMTKPITSNPILKSPAVIGDSETTSAIQRTAL